MNPAEEPAPIVPDAIEPIRAYRAWEHGGRGGMGELRSIALGGHIWLRGWNIATCRVAAHRPTDPRGHRPPTEGCTCGLYAMKGPFAMLPNQAQVQQGVHLMMGKVELAGKVIEHETGYRAERARVVELLPFRGQEPDAKVLAKAYGARVSREFEHAPTPTSLVGVLGPSKPWARRVSRCIERVGVWYFLLLLQAVGPVGRGAHGARLFVGIGMLVALGVAVTAYRWREPRGGRAARPTNPIKGIGVPGTVPGPRWWHDRPINGVFRLPPGR